MLIEVTGVSTRNKGAELMLDAVRSRFAHRAGVELVVDAAFGTFCERAAYGLWTKVGPMKWGRAAISVATMPRWFRHKLGLTTEFEINAVLDASGFAFGDQLGSKRSEAFARDVNRWKRQGKPIVLLPQALGPFENSRVRTAFLQVLKDADLIFARDESSYQFLNELAPQHPRIRLAPDFTNLVEPEIPIDFQHVERWACLVPNHRMVEKTSPEMQAAYIPFLANCIQELEREGIPCRILLHDIHIDEKLIEPLEATVGRRLSIIRESSPRRLKGILSTAHVVVGSRFHALVGSLCQSVPTIAVGWSHKYQGLMADYGCPDSVLTPTDSGARIRDVLTPLNVPATRDQLQHLLSIKAVELKQKVRAMWREVDSLLGFPSDDSSVAGGATSQSRVDAVL